MDKETIRILVVEDEPQWSAIIIDTVLSYLDNAAETVPHTVFVDEDEHFMTLQRTYIDEDFSAVSRYTDATIIAVRDMKRAEEIIREIPALHMVTMDMELIGSHTNIQEKQGMVLLEKIIEQHPDAACLVISGRANELEVAKNSITRYGAIDAIAKGSELDEISDSLYATLLYAEAKRLKKVKNFLDAQAQAKHGLQLIEGMTKNTKTNFKKRFDDFLRELDALALDEVSGLLNANVIIEHARRMLINHTRWALGIILLDGLTEFERTYHNLFQSNQAVEIVSRQIKQDVSTVIKDDTYQLGYLGEGKFIIIAQQSDDLKAVNDRLEAWFDKLETSEILYPKLEDKPRNLLSLRFFLKDSTQGINDLDQLLKLENIDGPGDMSW